MKHPGRLTRQTLAVAMALALPMSASADASYDELKNTVRQLQEQLQQVQKILKQQEAKVNKVAENAVTRQVSRDAQHAKRDIQVPLLPSLITTANSVLLLLESDKSSYEISDIEVPK
ncbi:MAG: hypothetical protein L3J94_12110 [Gammaproteobacteria bacterium]|nr:hypothetical protein [Gammaproteobacteria bacterium]